MAPKMMKPTMTGINHSAGIFADMTVDGPVIGDLVVVIDRARNLPNRKTMGKQDPYCAARLGKEAKKTETDRRGGQTPRWDQELRFVVHDSPDYYKLKVSVFNDDRKTDLVGETWIDLKEVVVRGGGQHDGWHTLNCRGRPAGELRMEITYYDTREREERLQEERPMRQNRESIPTGVQLTNVRRRPLPKGPSSNRTSLPAPSLGARREIMTRQPNNTYNDLQNEEPLDPYEHKHRMMATHGLPFDPLASRREDRRTYNGGPRPAPGQQSFTDLEKLSYRNRGLQLPDSPHRGGDSSSVQAHRDSIDRPTSYHQPLPQRFDEQPVQEILPVHTGNASAVHPDREAASDLAPRSHRLDTFYVLQSHTSDTLNQPTPRSQRAYGLFEGSSQGFTTNDYGEGRVTAIIEPQLSSHSRFEPEDDPLPPPPPPHRSNPVRSGELFPSEIPHQHMEIPSYLSQKLADLDGHDEFFRPPESATQLTTCSEPPIQTSPGNHLGYNHGNFLPQYGHHYEADAPLSTHPRSLQDIRSFAHAETSEYTSAWPSQEPKAEMDMHHGSSQHALQTSPQPPAYNLHDGSLQSPQEEVESDMHHYPSQPLQPATLSDRLAERPAFDDRRMRGQHDPYEERYSYRSSAPLVKPRAISPNLEAVSGNEGSSSATANQLNVARKSVSPAPEVRRRPESPRLSGVAFSPESFDVLNPQVSARKAAPAGNGALMIANYAATACDDADLPPSRSAQGGSIVLPHVEDAVDPDVPIRDSLGRLVDPSDHLPSSTWAPEPEPKMSARQPETKLRFRGAVPMPTVALRARRPSVELPELRSVVQSSHLTETPSNMAQSEAKTGRTKLQKRVRVMMTAGARRNGSTDDMALRDIPNTNARPVYGSDDARDHVGGERSGLHASHDKTRYEIGYEENRTTTTDRYTGAGDALAHEISSIDIGARTGARAKRTRFVTTVM